MVPGHFEIGAPAMPKVGKGFCRSSRSLRLYRQDIRARSAVADSRRVGSGIRGSTQAVLSLGTSMMPRMSAIRLPTAYAKALIITPNWMSRVSRVSTAWNNQLAHTRQGEYDLNDQGAADQQWEAERKDVQCRHDGIGQGVEEDHSVERQTFEMGHLYVVGFENFDEIISQQPGLEDGYGKNQRCYRQYENLEVVQHCFRSFKELDRR